MPISIFCLRPYYLFLVIYFSMFGEWRTFCFCILSCFLSRNFRIEYYLKLLVLCILLVSIFLSFVDFLGYTILYIVQLYIFSLIYIAAPLSSVVTLFTVQTCDVKTC